MAQAAAATSRKTPTVTRNSRRAPGASRVQDALSIAQGKGLLAGGRTVTIRGRMPEALVAQARRKTGIKSDSKLLEAALASIAVADEYGAWLVSQRGTVNPDLDLEF
jgi:hypothetical protein